MELTCWRSETSSSRWPYPDSQKSLRLIQSYFPFSSQSCWKTLTETIRGLLHFSGSRSIPLSIGLGISGNCQPRAKWGFQKSGAPNMDPKWEDASNEHPKIGPQIYRCSCADNKPLVLRVGPVVDFLMALRAAETRHCQLRFPSRRVQTLNDSGIKFQKLKSVLVFKPEFINTAVSGPSGRCIGRGKQLPRSLLFWTRGILQTNRSWGPVICAYMYIHIYIYTSYIFFRECT